MDHPRPTLLPVAVPIAADRALGELIAAIELVAYGVAIRVHVTGLAGLDEVAAQGLVRAQLAGVRFTLTREQPDTVTAIVGPRGE
ncbi:MAG: hypothetical protein A2V84_12215 [Chloroflexi bacterium RBG_16_70_13]|nr:MAG: hypothetical protein A2V84_12215 [Chloroflexi bacterium RBG_16_70_13]